MVVSTRSRWSPSTRPTCRRSSLITTRFDVEVGTCQDCGKRVQGRHPDQTSDALGSAAVQIGPNALALGCEMKHRLGISYGKIHTFFQSVFGFTLSRATFVRADHRLATLLEPTYEQLILSIRDKEVVHGDETGWKIGGHNAWLWVFTEEQITIYLIDPSRAHRVIERVLGEDFQGVLGCDCFLAYDAVDYRQQKCVAHLIRTAKELDQDKTRGAVRFPRAIRRLFQAAIRLKQRQKDLTPHGVAVARGRLEKALDRLLAGRFTDPDNARFARRLSKHRHQLFTFLDHPAVAPTNNAAERALRPAVIARKLSAGNRTPRGVYLSTGNHAGYLTQSDTLLIPHSGTYSIIVAGLDGALGSYTFSTTATPGPLNIGAASKPVSTVASVEVKGATVPAQIQLSTNYPNPFNASTTLRYVLPEASGVRLEIYDLMGQLVRVLVEEWQDAGEYQVAWDGQDGQGRSVSSGVYLYRLMGSNRIEQVRRMLLLR